jgi:myo-inositol-1(or 4)-monophosphatase
MAAEEYQECRRVAEQAARAAGALLLDSYGRVAIREKAPGDLVTDADRASQDLIARRLLDAFPDHTLLAEEDGVTPDLSRPWRWVVDPLDGTTNFAHGFPLWCVSIGLEHRGELVVGVVYAPLTGSMYSAALGHGLEVNGRPGRVSEATGLGEALVSTGIPVAFASDADRQLALFARFSTGTHSVRRTGTTALNLALVASGGCDLYYGTSAHPWDIAAGVVLVREGGGTVTGLRGEAFDLYRPGLLATNGRLHAEAKHAIDEAMGG